MNQQMNIMQIMQMIQSGQNPQQLVMRLLEERMGNTPMGQNLLTLAKQGNSSGIEQIVRNLSKQQGIDFDKEFSAFKQMFGMR